MYKIKFIAIISVNVYCHCDFAHPFRFGINCFVYLRDIIPAEASLKEEITNLRKIFMKMRKHHLKMCKGKGKQQVNDVQRRGRVAQECKLAFISSFTSWLPLEREFSSLLAIQL